MDLTLTVALAILPPGVYGIDIHVQSLDEMIHLLVSVPAADVVGGLGKGKVRINIVGECSC